MLSGGQIFAASFSPDGTHIAVAGTTVQSFDPRTEQFSAKSPAIAGGPPKSVVVPADGGVSVVIEDGSRTCSGSTRRICGRSTKFRSILFARR